MTVFVAGLIFDTVLGPWLATQTLVPSDARPFGLSPTGIVAITALGSGTVVVEVVGGIELVVVVELPGGRTAGAQAATRSPQAKTATIKRLFTRRISGSSPKDVQIA
jgi:hypothetical protein